ncbi:MAG: Rab family GTPase [Promethearchaeota archaeon]
MSRTRNKESKVLMVKVVMLGEPAVGKTSLVQRFVRESFGGRYQATMGLDLSLKEVDLSQGTVKIQLWDLGGQLAFKTLRQRFYSGTRGAMLVYDVTRPSTLHNLQIWLQELQTNVPTKTPFVVLGNKSDLGDMCVVNEKDEKSWAERSKALANYRTSAKTGDNVEEAFEFLASKIVKGIKKEKKEIRDTRVPRPKWDDVS